MGSLTRTWGCLLVTWAATRRRSAGVGLISGPSTRNSALRP